MKDLTEAKEIKKRLQAYTEELYKKGFNPDNYDGMVTNVDPVILDCEVKWALRRIIIYKASEGD